MTVSIQGEESLFHKYTDTEELPIPPPSIDTTRLNPENE